MALWIVISALLSLLPRFAQNAAGPLPPATAIQQAAQSCTPSSEAARRLALPALSPTRREASIAAPVYPSHVARASLPVSTTPLRGVWSTASRPPAAISPPMPRTPGTSTLCKPSHRAATAARPLFSYCPRAGAPTAAPNSLVQSGPNLAFPVRSFHTDLRVRATPLTSSTLNPESQCAALPLCRFAVLLHHLTTDGVLLSSPVLSPKGLEESSRGVERASSDTPGTRPPNLIVGAPGPFGTPRASTTGAETRHRTATPRDSREQTDLRDRAASYSSFQTAHMALPSASIGAHAKTTARTEMFVFLGL